ncbi:hypothetical protein [Sphingomonas sp. IW22]|uniref:hypothetical protein n=1 Tax=Sphingomonas sp. IW22 TaxID=3242489 RepID=UPI003521C775
MLVASHFLLWIAVILLAVALFALGRQVRQLRRGLDPVGPPVAVPIISAATLAGELLTIGHASHDGRAMLLLFVVPGCKRSSDALREAIARVDPDRMRLVMVGEGAWPAFADLARLHHIAERDVILDSPIARDMGIALRPAAVVIDAQGVIRASAAVHSARQVEALLASLPANDAAPVTGVLADGAQISR